MFDPIGSACRVWEKVRVGQAIVVMIARSNMAAVSTQKFDKRRSALLNAICHPGQSKICNNGGREARGSNLAMK